MTTPASNTSLSQSARLLTYLVPPASIILTAYTSPRAALLAPLSFIPSAVFYKTWQRFNSRDPAPRGKLELMIWIYATVGTVGLAAAMLVQTGLAVLVGRILFGSGEVNENFFKEFGRNTLDGLTAIELSARAELARSLPNWIFNGLLAYIMAALVEETLKYLPIAYARRRRTTSKNSNISKEAYIDYALAGALSFGVVENIGFIYAACEGAHEPWPKLLLTLFERVVQGGVAHLLTAALTAYRAMRRDYYGSNMSWLAVVGPSVLLHGTNNFVAMGASALEGNVGWIHPSGVRLTLAMIGLILGVDAVAIGMLRREWKILDGKQRRSK